MLSNIENITEKKGMLTITFITTFCHYKIFIGSLQKIF